MARAAARLSLRLSLPCSHSLSNYLTWRCEIRDPLGCVVTRID